MQSVISPVDKYNPALNWLIPLITILALIASGIGLLSQGGIGPHSFTTLHGQVVELYGQGVYHNDTRLIASGFQGADAIAVFIGLPLLIGSFIVSRSGSLRAKLFLAGMVSYFLYMGVSLTFSAAFNQLFLVYTALFSVSLFTLIAILTSIDLPLLAKQVAPAFPHRGTAIFLFVAGLGTLMLWLSDLVVPILNGTAPTNLGPYTTMFTHGFDSAVITPAAVLAGVCLLQKRPLGYLLTPPILIICVLNGINVIGATVSQTMAGIVFSPGVYIGMIGSWVVMGAFATWLAVAFFRNLRI